jgi:hypothetical protein
MPPRYWLEITDRHDLGADLWAPRADHDGNESAAYKLIQSIQPGDIILHYDTNPKRRCIVAYSRADGVAQSKKIEWVAHGTSARNAGIEPYWRPGWSVPLKNTTLLHSQLSLRAIQRRERAVRKIQENWATASGDARYMPFNFRSDGLRPQQAYLTRFPPALLRLFPELRQILRRTATPETPSRIKARPLRAKTFGKRYRRADEKKSVAKREPFYVDPDKVGRGVLGHKVTQNMVADYVEKILKREALSPRLPEEPPYDLGWECDRILYITEVKSLTDENEDRQLRLGLGQVLDYWRKLARSGKKVRAVLAVEREPTDRSFVAFCRDIGVVVVWPGHFQALHKGKWDARDLILSDQWRIGGSRPAGLETTFVGRAGGRTNPVRVAPVAGLAPRR